MSNNKLRTTARFVAWKIDKLQQKQTLKTNDFMIGKWLWFLEYRNTDGTEMRLTLTPKETPYHPLPIASLFVHVYSPPITVRHVFRDVKDVTYFEIDTRTLYPAIPVTLCLEFLDLKVSEINLDGKYYHSIWDEEHPKENSSTVPIVRMLVDSIYSDIVINAKDGSIKAHRAVLAASSPVFNTMFSENYIEKQTSTITINDMSLGACQAMVNFTYGKRESNELRTYHIELIIAADKYDIMNLKKACDADLCKDVGAKNVFDRLLLGHAYDLPELNSICIFYLIQMGMIYVLRENFNSFLREADPELTVMVVNACLDASKDA